jgi:hypothetical protein
LEKQEEGYMEVGLHNGKDRAQGLRQLKTIKSPPKRRKQKSKIKKKIKINKNTKKAWH